MRLVAVLKAAWELWRRPEASAPVIAVVVNPPAAYDFEANSFWSETVHSEQFQECVVAISKIERDTELEFMRSAVVKKDQVEAARAEAMAQVFEDLPKIFERYARRYQGREAA